MHHRGPVLWAQRTRLPDLEQEFEEGGRRFRHTKVRPCGVVKMEDLPGLPHLLKHKRTHWNCVCRPGKNGLVTLETTNEIKELMQLQPFKTRQDTTRQESRMWNYTRGYERRAQQLKAFTSRVKQQVYSHLTAIRLWKFLHLVLFEENLKTLSSEAHRCVLQFKNSNGVIGTVLLRQQPDDKARVCEGHLKLLCGRPVLCTLFLFKAKEQLWQ